MGKTVVILLSILSCNRGQTQRKLSDRLNTRNCPLSDLFAVNSLDKINLGQVTLGLLAVVPVVSYW